MQEISCSSQMINTLDMLKQEAQETYCRPMDWKMVVMLARYDRDSTLLVTSRGEIFQMPQSLANSFNRFSRENYCFEAEIVAGYQLVGSKYRGLVLLNFRMGKQVLHVKVPASKGGFLARLNAAEKVSALQLDCLHYMSHNCGTKFGDMPLANVYSKVRQLRQRSLDYVKLQFQHYVCQTFIQCYGEKPDDEFLKEFHHNAQRCYKLKF